MTTLYLVDNSVFQRLPHRPEVADALRALATSGLFATCLPITLEAGHSAMSATEHARVMRLIGSRRRLPLSDDVEQCAVELQTALWATGLVRAAGVMDLVIAAAAIVHGAMVLHYDADYEHIAKVSGLSQRWIVSRGSLA